MPDRVGQVLDAPLQEESLGMAILDIFTTSPAIENGHRRVNPTPNGDTFNAVNKSRPEPRYVFVGLQVLYLTGQGLGDLVVRIQRKDPRSVYPRL